jgi:hypothetical protein
VKSKEVQLDATFTVTLDELVSNITGSNVVELGKVPVLVAEVELTVDQLVAEFQLVVPEVSLL